MRTDLIHPGELGGSEIQTWRTMSRAAGVNSAFMEPEFAIAVGKARSDARVAIFEDEDGIAAFWPFHKRPLGFARPIGAPFSDQHGPVIRPGADFDIAAAVKSMQISAYAYCTLDDPESRFAAGARNIDDGYIAEAEGDGAAYIERLKGEHKRYHKTIERRRRKLENEHGAVEIILNDEDPEAFSRTIDWKRAQYDATGLHDVLAPAWVRTLLETLNTSESDDFGLRMATLRVEGKIIGGEICLLGADSLHSWIPAYDTEYGVYSPGLQLLRAVLEGVGEMNARRLDLGVGHGYYKRYFTFERRALSEGAAFAPGARAALMKTAFGGWRGLESAPLGPASNLAGKLRRRMSQIAATELGFEGKVRGMTRALIQHPPG